VGKTTVYVSSQVGWNAAQRVTDPADLGAQTRQALENLEIAVRVAGGSRTAPSNPTPESRTTCVLIPNLPLLNYEHYSDLVGRIFDEVTRACY
jgi:enamine deaminase RidA (YjgF/YER057c/UK114 family)